MKIRSLFASILVVVCQSGIARNIFQNSAFDAGASHWDVGDDSHWSNLQNYPLSASDHGGALLIATSGIDYAEQCAEVTPGEKYLLKLDTLDNSVENEWCSSSYFGVELTWWSGKACDFKLVEDDPLVFPILEGQNQYAWIEWGGRLGAPGEANSVRLTLSAECLTHRGTTKMYFDNAELLSDEIFFAGFDPK